MVYPFESLRTRNGLPLSILLPESARMMLFWATVLALFVGLTADVDAQAPSCRIPGGKVLETDSIARLISVPTPQGAALYSCIRRSGRKVALDDGFSDARLAGRWVAWQRPGHPGHWRIAVHDLRTGHERLVDGHVAAHSLGVTARGSIVWAQKQDSQTETPLFANEVKTGRRLLDPGAVDATSVRLAGRRVTWLKYHVEHSAYIR